MGDDLLLFIAIHLLNNHLPKNSGRWEIKNIFYLRGGRRNNTSLQLIYIRFRGH